MNVKGMLQTHLMQLKIHHVILQAHKLVLDELWKMKYKNINLLEIMKRKPFVGVGSLVEFKSYL